MPHGGGQTARARLGRIPRRSPLDRRGDALRQGDRPDRRPDRGLPRRRGSCPGARPSSSPSPPTTPTASAEDVTRWAQYQSNDTEVASVADGGQVESRRALRPGGDHGPLPGAGRRLPRHRAARACRSPGTPSSPPTTSSMPPRSKQWKALGLVPSEPVHRRRVHPPGRRSTSPARCPTAEEVQAVRRRPRPGQAGRSWSTASSTARVRLVLRQQVGRHPPQQARGQRRSASAARSPSTTGSARTSPGTRPTTSSSGRSSRPAARPRRRRRSSGTAGSRRPTPSSTTPPRSSSACGSSAPSATTTRSRSGARTTTTASPPSSPGSAASRRCIAQRAGRNDEVIFTARTGIGHPPEDGPGDDPEAARRRR